MSVLGTRLSRVAVATGVAAAAIAIPVTAASAASAHGAVPAAAPAAAAPAAAHAEAPAAAPAADAAQAADASYKVVRGDTLSKIANAQHVDGGWKKLYQDNRQVIGGNPNLIFPGQKLTVGGHAVQAAAPQAETKKSDAAASRSEKRTPVQAAPKPAAPQTEAAKPAAPKTEAAKPAAPKTEAAKPAAPKTEAAKPAAPKTEAAKPAAAASGYVAPVAASLGTPYHKAGSNWSSGYHTGVDFAVSTGTSIHAIAAGTVVEAGWGGAYGNNVVIKHADGKYSQYAHFSALKVSVGQTVTAGQIIGLSGATGNVTGPHLHFEVRTTPSYGSDIDPVAYLAAHGVRV
ncbi:peptidoglycan DD-metalloendopeptidase family protein [Kitasatospora sp. NPDC085895]|uniref:LysM peptidoglycan-binding domain-containing M23 family metallopeptidase n=1 Tax=Kitasatospora sp. NPDC085895 TaxID=3155057 RepID=UPI00344F148A